jgi:hypothetical protein
LGLLLTTVLMEKEQETWADRYLPDSLRGLQDRASLRDLQDKIAHLPDAIARRVPEFLRH